MLDDQLIQLIDATAAALELANPVVEKDYYVTQVIHALSNIEDEYFRLVFAGGTCLAKAYKIVKRMSEDVDFKIQRKQITKNFSKTRFFKELKQFRSNIISKLQIADLTSDTSIVCNEGQYLRVQLNYPSIFSINSNLRPHILLECTLADVHLSLENLSIRTLIEDTLENVVIFEPSSTQCVSVYETAIEKWVSLTRRIIAIEREYHSDDATLIRHLYDLSLIKHADKINPNFFSLAKVIVNNDAKKFKNQHPEYWNNPNAEILQSLTLLKNKSVWKTRYQEFIEAMVYDNSSAQEYEAAIHVLENISASVICFLNQSQPITTN